MRTSLNNIRQIDDFLEERMSASDAFLFQAKMILNTNLRSEVRLQQKTTALVKLYGRNRLREELENIHHDIFKAESNHFLKKRIQALFINP